ncbi:MULTISPECIES: hypothetical protein [unclassified Haloarcula]|uniref:hypothetical protein n=1 Tax=unclassified Haloarcula TaxID=2624677 RepID=UPI001784807C|nr:MULTISPECIES: hypothetical protein [unclassified Haloarcula]
MRTAARSRFLQAAIVYGYVLAGDVISRVTAKEQNRCHNALECGRSPVRERRHVHDGVLNETTAGQPTADAAVVSGTAAGVVGRFQHSQSDEDSHGVDADVCEC